MRDPKKSRDHRIEWLHRSPRCAEALAAEGYVGISWISSTS